MALLEAVLYLLIIVVNGQEIWEDESQAVNFEEIWDVNQERESVVPRAEQSFCVTVEYETSDEPCVSKMAKYVNDTDIERTADKWLRKVRKELAQTELHIKAIEKTLARRIELQNLKYIPRIDPNVSEQRATAYNLQHSVVPEDFKEKYHLSTGYIVSTPGQRYKMKKGKRMTFDENHFKSFLLYSKNNIRDVRHCAHECYYAEICLAFNYSKSRQKCELFTVKSDVGIGVLQLSNSTDYFERYL